MPRLVSSRLARPRFFVGFLLIGACAALAERWRPEGVPAADPGRVTAHRLNRFEYNNTVRDLLGPSKRPAHGFPPEDHAFGFDNNADVLRISPVEMLLYGNAARDLVEEALARPAQARL